ncbi:GGDEF domain-containing protein [Neorhizobium sp. CSC1952]|uniref:GGDEF domain-containing protein n=1 Tax=Neorhizobium sp. CSC1952 TaxID=2978974 RepID=UPI0025A5D081|nr:GGDEF domain-containing protein [Rhizobium sp. CSC1952]WJR67362.1 GGDEF domain-containing protein [Rhizobium sp. CSC1952]
MDILTGLMIWAAEALTLAALLWSRWLYQRDDFYLSWGGGFALHGAGVALVALRGDIPDFVSIEIANTMALAGMGLWITGLLQFDNKPVQGYVAIPALIWVAGMFLNPVREDFSNRVALYNGAAMVGYAIMVGLLLRHNGASRTTRRLMACFIGIQLISSGVVAAMSVVADAQSFETSPNAAWLFFPAAFCFIAGIMSGGKMLTERSEEKLKALAVTDPLTGALNRRGLIDEFHGLRSVDNAEKPLIALLHFDLDSFKQINDRCGHQAGDAVLVAFSKIGSTSLRGRGLFGGMGGEEFASILRVADMVEAASIAEAIRLTLKHQTIIAGEHRIKVTVSAGIALATVDGADLDLLLSAADRALYTAKESGRDRTAIDTGAEASIVPAADRQGEEEGPSDLRANHQVAALKRLAALGKR